MSDTHTRAGGSPPHDRIVARLGDLDRRHLPARDDDPDGDGEENHRR